MRQRGSGETRTVGEQPDLEQLTSLPSVLLLALHTFSVTRLADCGPNRFSTGRTVGIAVPRRPSGWHIKHAAAITCHLELGGSKHSKHLLTEDSEETSGQLQRGPGFRPHR